MCTEVKLNEVVAFDNSSVMSFGSQNAIWTILRSFLFVLDIILRNINNIVVSLCLQMEQKTLEKISYLPFGCSFVHAIIVHNVA